MNTVAHIPGTDPIIIGWGSRVGAVGQSGHRQGVKKLIPGDSGTGILSARLLLLA
jgi:hypothetical protein